MSYDEAIQKLDAIIASLEQEEAMPMEEYKQKAQEAKELITFCQKQLTTIEEDLREVVSGEL